MLDDDKALLDAVSAAFALAVDRHRLASSVHAQASDARQLPSGPVTFLYADVEGSTLLLDRLGERYADFLAEERRLLRTIVRDNRGVRNRFAGGRVLRRVSGGRRSGRCGARNPATVA